MTDAMLPDCSSERETVVLAPQAEEPDESPPPQESRM